MLRKLEGSLRVRRILVTAILVALAACAGHRTVARLAPTPAPLAPKPAEGLWAALDPGCARPTAANIRAWPHCASPFWISRDHATLLVAGSADKNAVRDVSYAADYRFTAGEPLIAQVGTEKDGYVWLALTNLDRDSQGRLVGAVGVAVPCAPPSSDGVALKPRLNGCSDEDLEAVRRAALNTLQDHASLTTVSWIAPGVP